MITGILFSIVVGSYAPPAGFSVKTFGSMSDCQDYYNSLNSFTLKQVFNNFYKSNERIMEFDTPFGVSWAICKANG